jgi:Flp pilus assembly protein TadG
VPEVEVALGSYRPRRRTENGAAALEFALVMPVLLLLVFALIQYGMYFWAYQGGADAARQAARSAAVGAYPKDCAGFRTEVRNAIGKMASNQATVTRTFTKSNSALGVQPGDLVTVKVEYNSLNLNFPFLPFIQDGFVSQTAQARVDNVTDSTADNCT